MVMVQEKELAEKNPSQFRWQHTRCDLCNNLRKRRADDLRMALEMTAEQAVRAEDSKSCDKCSLIVEGIRQFENASWSLRTDVSLVYMYALSSRGDSLTVEVYFRTDRPKLVLEFYHTDESESPWEAIRRRSPVAGYPVLTKGVQWVKSTLEQCLSHHASCAITEEPLFPKRTLYVEKLSTGDVCVKVCEHEKKRGRYTALSHCWGSQQTCTTTSTNLKAYKQSVPWEALSVTFQDAIIFTLALGVHHIWIDSLCIIQNDAKDWEVESSKMGNVYQNAYLTLAATAANDGSKGCFSVQRQQVQEYHLHPKNGDRSVIVREKIQHWEVRSTLRSMKFFPLLTRGWVLQERYLSPRTLHFCAQELVWECLEDLTCECGGILADSYPLKRLQPSPPVHVRNRVEYPELQTTFGNPPSYAEATAEVTAEQQAAKHLKHMSDQWHRIVEQYTSLRLTKETDRLPALSGLATSASSILGTYSCGLWIETIADDLLWRVPLLEHHYGRPTKFTGPSWSWASVNAPVVYWTDLGQDDHALDHDIERLQYNLRTAETWHERREAQQVLQWRLDERAALRGKQPIMNASCNVTLKGKNPFGEVSSGVLRLTGRVKSAVLLYVKERESAESMYYDTHQPLKYQLGVSSSPVETETFDLVLPFFADYVLSEGPNSLPDDTPVILFQLKQNICLVLTGGPSEFQRIGIVRESSGYQSVYDLDWMARSFIKNITIV